MSNYIGFIHCDKCKTQYIEDPSTVTVWWNADDSQQLAEVVCPKCGKISSDFIDTDTLYIFRMADCNFKPFNDKFSPLTEELIDSWDIEDELAELVI